MAVEPEANRRFELAKHVPRVVGWCAHGYSFGELRRSLKRLPTLPYSGPSLGLPLDVANAVPLEVLVDRPRQRARDLARARHQPLKDALRVDLEAEPVDIPVPEADDM